MNKKIMSFSLDVEAIKQFKKITSERGISMSFLINQFIKEWVAKNKD